MPALGLPMLRGALRRSLPPRLLCRSREAHIATTGVVYYMSDEVERSLYRTGRVGTHRDLAGSDSQFFGVEYAPTRVDMADARGKELTLDGNGFALTTHSWDHIDYYDNDAILNTYYDECEALVRKQTGASRVLAFDHNLRARRRKQTSERLAGASGSAIQEPLIRYGVHNDYTLDSAARRVVQLAQPLGANDTLRDRPDAPPPLDPNEVEQLLRGRWMFVNVWRNVSSDPVMRSPIALCDATSVDPTDLIVFEIRYADRVGENYFVRGSQAHRWYYFPAMTRDEALLIKCWDSRGRDFFGLLEEGRGHPSPPAAAAVPATFSLHTGFEDDATAQDAPQRESIEVRTVAFFADQE